jgi:hypothetical protein
LLAWGLGHLRLGDRRGWALLIAEAAWLVTFLVSLALLPTDRWLVCYALLAGFVIVWVGQAVWSYRIAHARDPGSNGAAWLLALAPVVIVLLTGFWLFAGSLASPAATLERYVGAWQHGDTAGAVRLLAQPRDEGALAADWEFEDAVIAKRVKVLGTADARLGLDIDHPDQNVRFEAEPGDPSGGADPDIAMFEIQIVHSVSVRSTFLGIVPTSRTETRVLEVLGTAIVVRRDVPGLAAAVGASEWLLQDVVFEGMPAG